MPRITQTIAKTAIDLQFFVRALKITYSEIDRTNLIQRHNELLNSIAAGNTNLAVELWQAHIKTSVAEFTADKSSDEMIEQFERPLMSQVIHATRQELN